MKKLILSGLMTIAGSFLLSQQALAEGVTISKATELGVHRIERLVTLQKIDAAFQTALIGMKAEPTTESGASFKVYGYLAPGADGKSTFITLWQDAQGKTLAYTVTTASAPQSPFAWPTKDSVTLFEEGLHFVIEGWAKYPEVKAYYTGLQNISLTPVKDSQGNLMAQYKVSSTDDNRVLTLNLKPDGTYISHDLK